MSLDTLPPEIVRIIFDHFAHDPKSRRVSAQQAIWVANTCRMFRELLYKMIWQHASITVYDDYPVPNVELEQIGTSYSFQCDIVQDIPILPPKSIMKHVQTLCYNTLRVMDSYDDEARINEYSDFGSYQVINPSYLPSLKELKVCAYDSELWSTLQTELSKFPRKIKLSIETGSDLPTLSAKLRKLVHSLHVSISPKTEKARDFTKKWKQIQKMPNLESLTVFNGIAYRRRSGETLPLVFEKPDPLVLDSLRGLHKLHSLYIDSYRMAFPMDAPWFSNSLTTLECSLNNFVVESALDTSKLTTFDSVTDLTLVLPDERPVECTKLPFYNLTKLDIISERTPAPHQRPEVNELLQHFFSLNKNLENLKILVSWDIDLAIWSENHYMQSLKILDLNIRPEILSEKPTILCEFLEVLGKLPRLNTLTTTISISDPRSPLVTHDEFVKFVLTATHIEKLRISVQLIGTNALTGAEIMTLQYQDSLGLRPLEDLLVFLPIQDLGPESKARKYFKMERLRNSSGYGQSWFVDYTFDALSFRSKNET